MCQTNYASFVRLHGCSWTFTFTSEEVDGIQVQESPQTLLARPDACSTLHPFDSICTATIPQVHVSYFVVKPHCCLLQHEILISIILFIIILVLLVLLLLLLLLHSAMVMGMAIMLVILLIIIIIMIAMTVVILIAIAIMFITIIITEVCRPFFYCFALGLPCSKVCGALAA